MQIEEESLILQGHQLHRLILHPDTAPKGTLLFFHGQGDYVDRYPPLLEIFVSQGWQCFLTDLPGHGRSSNKRGHIPGLAFIDSLVDKLPLMQRSLIAGHSMGGMLALRELLRRPTHYQAAWLSSPLLAPARQTSPLMLALLPLVASCFPWITRNTGVRSEDCQSGGRSKGLDSTVLYHHLISLGWARELIKAAKELENQWDNLPTTQPLLFTQGSADPVCPAALLKERLSKLRENKIIYREISEGLHEPFSGETAGEFRRILKKESPILLGK